MSESQHTEWKEFWRDEYLRWICGFANAEGGVLVVGRNDKGAPVGVPDAKKLLEDLPNKIRDVLGIMADVRLVRERGKDLIEIRVAPYPYPVSYKGEYHYRSGSTKQELKGAALDRFLLKKQGRSWDGVPVPDVSVRSLSKSAVEAFRSLARQSQRVTTTVLKESTSGLVEKLHLLDGKYLKRAAVLAFHPEPERFVTGAYVKIGYFRTNDDLLYHDEVHGDLFKQVAQSVELLVTKYLKSAISYRGIQRIETLPVPEPALREAVLNAIIHRDYSTGTPVQISIYADKLMIWNPGQLPPDWTVEKLKAKHSSQPFNPNLANVFFRAGEIEAWGRGIERILVACREARFPEPILEYEASGIWVKFPFSRDFVARMDGPTAGVTPEKTPVKTPEKILAILAGEPGLSLAEVGERIGRSERAVERAVAKLVQSGKLRRIGPDKGGRWEVMK